jgi:hypothetical protein
MKEHSLRQQEHFPNIFLGNKTMFAKKNMSIFPINMTIFVGTSISLKDTLASKNNSTYLGFRVL